MRISDWSSDVCSSDLLRLDQLRRVRRHGDRGGGDGGLAARIEPAQLVGVPAIRSLEGQGAADAEFGAPVRARDREQQARVVAAWIVDRAAEREVMGSHVWILLRSEEHTSELQSLMRSSYAVFCLKKKTQ